MFETLNINATWDELEDHPVQITLCFAKSKIHFFVLITSLTNNKKTAISYVPSNSMGYFPCCCNDSELILSSTITEEYIPLYTKTLSQWNLNTMPTRYNLLFFYPVMNISNCLGYSLTYFV